MGNNDFNRQDRRNYSRIIYQPGNRASLIMGSRIFEVMDITESGVRFINENPLPPETAISGSILFLNGEMVDIEGKVEWQEEGEVGMSLSALIPSQILKQESRHLIVHSD
ncbi:MAG: hypothetical protein K9L30_00630 [Desulfobacterales bacterium]|nr:hypothetical protein [Desulfobacterales bacterium]